jgi:hypothetical protein
MSLVTMLIYERPGPPSRCSCRARQGKSFILNQLLQVTGGFQIGSTTRPCTKGLWMWSTPQKRVDEDGKEYHIVRPENDSCCRHSSLCRDRACQQQQQPLAGVLPAASEPATTATSNGRLGPENSMPAAEPARYFCSNQDQCYYTDLQLAGLGCCECGV